jgi:tyrosine-protein kinase Etk/Wzc
LHGNEGAEFILVHRSHLRAVAGLQSQLNIAERGKSSGVISVQLEGTNRRLIANEINQIGEEYIKQNIERKSAEAENTLAFLNDYLPSLKKSLEEAEDRYIKLRNEKGTVDLTEEVKLTLERSVETRKKLAELNIRRDEMLNRFTPVHPSIQSLDAQIASLRRESAGLNEEIRKLPSLEREVLTVTRDVKINSELYTSLLNTAQQLRLVKAGKVGSVRIVDPAVVPEVPVRPKKMQSLILFVLAGMVFGVIVAFIKKRLFGGIEDPSEIEQHTGLSVLASVPESAKLMLLSERIESRQQGIHLLEKLDPTEPAVESLRSFRTALQFSMLNARNNMILMTGPTPGIGKSVVCSNFAATLAATGKKVLLVDLDLRKGYLNHYFGLPREGGISEFVLGDRTFEQVVHRNVVENLDFTATGTLPPAPNMLLLHDNLRQFLERAAAEYDLVLVDSPPVLAVTDSTVMAPLFGTKILIVRENMTTLGELGETIKRFNQIGETVTGVLFNGIRPRVGYAYGYGKYRYRNYAYGSAADNE